MHYQLAIILITLNRSPCCHNHLRIIYISIVTVTTGIDRSLKIAKLIIKQNRIWFWIKKNVPKILALMHAHQLALSLIKPKYSSCCHNYLRIIYISVVTVKAAIDKSLKIAKLIIKQNRIWYRIKKIVPKILAAIHQLTISIITLNHCDCCHNHLRIIYISIVTILSKFYSTGQCHYNCKLLS